MHKKKRYLFCRRLDNFHSPGGCEKHVYHWFNLINSHDYDITFAISRGTKTKISDFFKKLSLSIKIAEFPFPLNDQKGFFKNFLNMYSFLKKVNPTDIVFVQGGFADFNFPIILAAFFLLKAIFTCPSIQPVLSVLKKLQQRNI